MGGKPKVGGGALEEYVEMFESGKLDSNEVIRQFQSRSWLSKFFVRIDEEIKYDAALRYQARQIARERYRVTRG